MVGRKERVKLSSASRHNSTPVDSEVESANVTFYVQHLCRENKTTYYANKSLRANAIYYTTQALRGPITKINHTKCSIAGPIFSKYWTGHCPE